MTRWFFSIISLCAQACGKFRLIARASGARRIIGLQNGQAGFLTDSLPDGGFGARHQAQYWLDLVGLLGAPRRPRPAQVRRHAQSMLGDSQDSPIVVMHAGSGGYSPARRWGMQQFAELARLLHEGCGARIVVLGQEADRGQALAESLAVPAVDLTGQTSLPQLADIIANADLFVGADSGVMHIAAAVGSPVLCIFGPSNADAWQPWTVGGLSAVLRSGVACSPCSYIGGSIGAREGCAARTCMKLVGARQAFAAALELLAGREPAQTNMRQVERRVNRRLHLLGVPVDAVSYGDFLALIAGWIGAGGGARQVCTVNPEFIMITQGDPIFLGILHRAALCVPDGAGLLWACRRRGIALPERVTGSDGLPRIAEAAAQQGWRIFLLGAAPGVAERAAAVLQKKISRAADRRYLCRQPRPSRRRRNSRQGQCQPRRYLIRSLWRAAARQVDRPQFAAPASVDGDGCWRLARLHRGLGAARARLDARSWLGMAVSAAEATLAAAAHVAAAPLRIQRLAGD